MNGAATTSPSASTRISRPTTGIANAPPSMVSRGREKRSSQSSAGSARPIARVSSGLPMLRASRACGSHGMVRPASICMPTKASTRPQTSGIGGGIGRQFGSPSRTTSSE